MFNKPKCRDDCIESLKEDMKDMEQQLNRLQHMEYNSKYLIEDIDNFKHTFKKKLNEYDNIISAITKRMELIEENINLKVYF